MTAQKQIIAVIGATGAQGGALVRTILADQDSPFAARAITRHVDSDKAKALAALGAEVVAADLDDQASLERAFAGAYGAFCLTNFWEHSSPEKELAQAANLARAAKASGVRHAIWSTLEDTRKWVPLNDNRMPTLQGKYKVPTSTPRARPTSSSATLTSPPRSCSHPSTGITSSTSGRGRSARRMASSRSSFPWMRSGCRGSRRRTSARAPTGSSSAGRS